MKSDVEELWKSISGYEGLYEVSNIGRIKSVRRIGYKGRIVPERILKQNPDSYGYPIVGLHKDGKSKTRTVHRLVAEAFIPNPLHFKEVIHKDENKWNNCVDNLEWCTTQYNLTYGHRLDCARGERSHLHKLTKEQIAEIKVTCVKGDPNFGYSALGRKYGVSHTAIEYAVKNKTWKHLKENEFE